MELWKARLGMLWNCVGMLDKPAAAQGQDEKPFPFIHGEEEQHTQPRATHLL